MKTLRRNVYMPEVLVLAMEKARDESLHPISLNALIIQACEKVYLRDGKRAS